MLLALVKGPALVAALAVAAVGAPPHRVEPPLAGRVVVVDPGHQLGNGRHPAQTGRLVDAGGLRKPCNTSGTATNGGYAEATFAWGVATRLRTRLQRLGATVLLTRTGNDAGAWGPCVDERGRAGNGRADLKISIHGDGAAAGAHGFHLIVAATGRRAASTAYAEDTRAALQRAGFARSTYVGGGTALDVRSDLGTLNLSRMPSVMAELGNMRNAGDAAVMSSAAGQDRYAAALAAGIRAYLGDHAAGHVGARAAAR